MLFACLYVPDLILAAARRAEPLLHDEAMVVVEGVAPLRMVAAASGKAVSAGVIPGMAATQAELRLPGLRMRPRSALEEAGAHAALLDCAHAFSPRVEDAAADTVLLDLDGLERLFGPPAAVARDLARRAADFGLEVNVAVSANLEASMTAARGFAGVTLLPAGDEAVRLGTLPLEVLCPATELLQTLDRWGIRTLRALSTLPAVAVVERLGQEGLLLQERARGASVRTFVPTAPALKFAEALELEHPVELLEPLAFLLHGMLEHLCARLSARALAAIELRLCLHLCAPPDATESARRGPPRRALLHQRTLRLPVPMQDARLFLKLLQLDLRAHPPAGPVAAVELAAEPARPRAVQGGLFLPAAPEADRLELTLARLAAIVGAERVGCAEPADTHRPGEFRMVRFNPQPPGQECATLLAPGPGARMALRVFRPPQRTQVRLQAGVPAGVLFSGRWYEVAAAAGPWRLSGGWWADLAWAREEWDLLLRHEENPAFYRAYCLLPGGGWFLEGVYD